jgi:tRNA threonylcarbamoyladenosine biosynthesis protein TsaB
MNVLGIDTALEACSVGFAAEGRAPIVRSETVGRGHAERLFGLVAEVITAAGSELGAIDLFAVTTGPGSFTGIRVGIAAVRGFALVSGARTAGFSTLAVHAEAARSKAGKRAVLASLPAKGGELFAQLFAPDGSDVSEPLVTTPERAAELAVDAEAVLAGAGSAAVAAAAPGAKLTVIHDQSAPDIAALLRLAVEHPGLAGEPKPLYIKPPDAEPARVMLARR